MERHSHNPAGLVFEKGAWLLVGLVTAFCSRALFFGESFFLRDLYKYYLPQRAFQAESLLAGEIPFWNPFLHGGSPFLADVNHSPFYPTNLIYLVLDPRRAMVWEIVLHLAASAVAAYLLCRVLGLRQPEAVAGGGVFVFCGLSLSSTNFLGRLLGAPYLPLLILFLHLAFVERRRRWWWLALTAGVLQLLAGAPEMIACGLVGALGWSLFTVDSQPFSTKTAVWRRAAATVALGLAVAGVAAFQLVPLAELVSLSSRGTGLTAESVGFWSLVPQRLPELVIPGFLGPATTFELTDYWGWKIVDTGYPYFLSLYLGAVTLVLAVIGGLAPGRLTVSWALRRCLLAQMVLGIVLCLGRFLPGFEAVVEALPILGVFRYPVKAMTLALVPLAILTACGVSVLRSFDARQWRCGARVLAAAWVGLGVPLAAALLIFSVSSDLAEGIQRFFFDTSSPAITAGLLAACLHVLAAMAAATWIAFVARRPRAWQSWALAMIVTVDLMIAGTGTVVTAPPGTLLDGEPAAVRPLREAVGEGRFFRAAKPPLLVPESVPSNDIVWLYRWNQEILRSFVAAGYEIPMIFHDDFSKLAPRRLAELSTRVRELPWDLKWRFLSSAGVQAVVTHEELAGPEIERITAIGNASGQPFHIYRYRGAADQARVIPVWLVADSEASAFDAMLGPGFDPRRHAVVEGDLASRPKSECGSPATTEVEMASHNLRRWRVSAPCSGLMILGEMLYPGWRATVDGQRTPPVRADLLWAAVPIEAGDQTVEWRYVPRIFLIGLGVSVAALGLFALCLGRARGSFRDPAR